VLLVIGDEATSTRRADGPFAKKRMTHKLGWMVIIPNGETLKVAFKDAEHMTNISFTGIFYSYSVSLSNCKVLAYYSCCMHY